MTSLRTYGLAVLLLGGLGCRPSEPAPAPPSAVEPAPVEPPVAEPEAPEPPPLVPEAPTASWRPITESVPLSAKRTSGDDTRARYALTPEHAKRPSFELELRVSESATELRLSEPQSGHALEHSWVGGSCSYEFYDGDNAGAAITEIAQDEHGRRLLQLWVSCSSGEDIRFIDSIMLLIVADAEGFSLLWTGEAYEHGSHVCSNWTDIGVDVFDADELLIRESEHWEIFEPESVPDYDCDDARNDERTLAEHRVPLPG